MNKRKYFTFCMFLITSVIGHAQFKIDAEIRPRTEFNDGVKTLLTNDQKPALITSQRSRLNLGLTDEKINVFFSIQDCRIWGESVYKKDIPTTLINEAWASYAFNQHVTLKLGRQVLAYDDKRLFGPSDWGMVGASHDIGLLKVNSNDLKFDLGFTYNNNTDKKFESNYPLDFYKYLGFLWINKSITKDFSVSLMNIVDGYQKEDSDSKVYSRFTNGIYGNYQNDSSFFSGSFSAYYQYGETPSGREVSSYFFSITPSFKLTKNIKAIAGIDFFSGDNAFSSGDTDNSFSKLYGDSHGYYGYMDYFTEIENDTKGSGLADIYISFQFKTSTSSSLELALHNFSLTNNAIDSISSSGNYVKAKRRLGNEIDLMYKQKLSSNVEFRAGYSTMLATETMELFKGGDHKKYQQWAWLTLIFKPTFYKSEQKRN